ncbi:MAG TPA: DUF2892 domain-containing protein [bacterium]|nr:DUF2892 domain-containing protein [bacterium]HDP97880.1 DUF2892 domain-containing protein [bacterium]
MKQNIGAMDKLIRIIVGLVIILLGVFGVIGWWGLIGLIPIITALVGHCPIYAPFGISTCKVKTEEKK